MRPKEFVWQRYPPIPKDASVLDVVEEYMLYEDDNKQLRKQLVGRVYCPKEKVEYRDELFDPLSESAQKALEKYAKQIKNRRRYQKDVRRRRLREG